MNRKGVHYENREEERKLVNEIRCIKEKEGVITELVFMSLCACERLVIKKKDIAILLKMPRGGGLLFLPHISWRRRNTERKQECCVFIIV